MVRDPAVSRLVRSSKLLALLLFLFLTGCEVYYGVWRGGLREQVSEAVKAETLTAQGKYLEAIDHYEKHILNRKIDSRRLPSENPEFYNLYIGDLYIKLDRPQDAEERYRYAPSKDVDSKLVGDRLIRLSRYLSGKGSFSKAIALLRTNRELDVDAFDAEIDEIHKKSVAAEERATPERKFSTPSKEY